MRTHSTAHYRAETAHQPRTTAQGVTQSVPWAVVHTHPQAERWAAAGLERAGYRTYLPLYATTRRDRHTPTIRHVVECVLFPRYVFLALAPGDPWAPARYTPGVAGLLMNDGHPATCPQEAIEALQATEALRRTLTAPGAHWRPGDAVRLAGGPFDGADATVLAVRTDVADVALIAFGGLTRAQVALDQITQRIA